MIFNQSKISSSEPILLSLNVLNIYQIKILQSVQFMDKIKNKNTPYTFLKLFIVPCHAYPANVSLINFPVPQKLLKTSWFAVPGRGPIL